MGLIDQAWRLHETAKAAAREGGNPAVLGYARAQQAYVLLDLGRTGDAWSVLRDVRERDSGALPPVLRVWLQAAEGEMLAALGDRDGALRALDSAADELPAQSADPDLPFLMLDAGHLARWRGHCLARLGEASAVESLTAALAGMGHGQYGRAEAALRVDLAIAFRARGDIVEAQGHARRGAEIAGRTGSQRQRRRIELLLAA